MASPHRSEPLRADPVDPFAGAVEPPSRARSVALGVAVGFGVAVAGIAIAFSIVAIPLFIVASTEPSSGLDRGLVRTGLFKVALPFGVVSGLVAGIAVGIWYARGGRLPRDRAPLEL
jgi:riboflavin transporter FmnP